VTIAFVLLALSAWLMQRDRRLDERSRAVWLIVPIALLLTNIHLYAVFLPASVLGLLIGACWESKQKSPGNAGRIRRYAILLLLTTLASLCTPMLPGVIRSALHYQFNDPMVASPCIEEMQPFYLGKIGKAAAIFVAGIIVLAIWNRRALRAGEWLWLIGGTVAMIRLGRFAPVFGIFAAPTLAATMPRLSNNLFARPAVGALLALLCIGTAVKLYVAFPDRGTSMNDWLREPGVNANFPIEAADFIEANVEPRTHHLINEFNWGGYLEWRLGDRYQVLLDGRTQVFPPEMWRRLYLGTEEQRKQFLGTIPADAAILPKDNSVFRDALLALGWHSGYADNKSEVLFPPDSPIHAP
jgi:hypothetical protein